MGDEKKYKMVTQPGTSVKKGESENFNGINDMHKETRSYLKTWENKI